MIKIPKTAQIAKFAHDSELSNSSYEIVANYLQENKSVTQKEIGDKTGLSKSVVHRAIKALKNEGLVILLNKKEGRQSLYQWVGGTSAIEDELQRATEKHVSASILAETYDSLVADAFALFSVLFDGPSWEVIANLKGGLTDTELHQSIGSDIPIDSIRRILVVCDAHNLIKISRIRSSAGSMFIKLFEPLYRIDSVNKELLSSLILIRGLAAAIRFDSEGGHIDGFLHPFSVILDLNKKMYTSYQNCALSSKEDEELITKILSKGYDYVPDFDRIYRAGDWREKMKSSKFISRDEMTDAILFDAKFEKNCQRKIIKDLGDLNE